MPTKEEISFVTKYWWYAVRAARRYGHNPTYMLAQSVAERGYKGSTLSDTYNNFFGIISTGKTDYGKFKYWKGRSITLGSRGLSFRVYDSLQDSFYDYALLLDQDRYRSVIKNGTPEEFAQSIAYSSYIAEVNGDNREVYKRNILNAIAKISAISKPLAYGTKLLLFSAFAIGAVAALDYYKVIDLKKLT